MCVLGVGWLDRLGGIFITNCINNVLAVMMVNDGEVMWEREGLVGGIQSVSQLVALLL